MAGPSRCADKARSRRPSLGWVPFGIAAAFVGAASAAGCGASYQSMYEGEVRFEHCYRIDEEQHVPLTQRRECWREWTKFYTYGQTRDRLEYALKRQRALTAQIDNPGGSAVAPEAEDTARLAAPAPTSPFEPPPHVHTTMQQDAGAADTGLDPSAVEKLLAANTSPPGQRCLLGCLKSWHGCVEVCERPGEPCRKACDDSFRGCVSRCITP